MDDLQQKTMKYIDIHQQIRDILKWKVPDNRILMMIASLYVVNNKEFNNKLFLEIVKFIKKKSGIFSTLRSHTGLTTAAMLDVNFEDPKEQIRNLSNLYKQFIKGGFGRGAFTYIAASVVLTNEQKTSNHSETINKAMTLYKRMGKEHAFLTNRGDYPLATLLAHEDEKIDELIQRMEMFYSRLNQNGFRKGNDLQFLSHILSMNNQEDINSLVSRALYTYDTFKEVNIRPKTLYYPVMGMLTLLPDGEIDMGEITGVYEQLNKEKHFKWQKDTNLIMAVNFYTSGKVKSSNLTDTSIYTTMETIIQAQQAVMIAATSSATAAASSNSGQ